MARWAIISGGLVENVIVWDGVEEIELAVDQTAEELSPGQFVRIGTPVNDPGPGGSGIEPGEL